MFGTTSNLCIKLWNLAFQVSLFACLLWPAQSQLGSIYDITHADRPLLVSDLKKPGNPAASLVSIRISKTNQSGPPTIISIPVSSDRTFCCVTATQQFIQIRPLSDVYFSIHLNGLPMTRSQFGGVLAKAIKALGLLMHVYTSHSFRIGRASDLASLGFPQDTIKRLGRWRSSAVDRYIRN